MWHCQDPSHHKEEFPKLPVFQLSYTVPCVVDAVTDAGSHVHDLIQSNALRPCLRHNRWAAGMEITEGKIPGSGLKLLPVMPHQPPPHAAAEDLLREDGTSSSP